MMEIRDRIKFANDTKTTTYSTMSSIGNETGSETVVTEHDS